MVTFVGGFVDPEIARVQQPLNDEIRRRTAGLSPEERQRVSQELRANVVIPKTTVAHVADHIDYVRKVAGVEHVGVGGDFDGASDWPEGLSDVSMYPNLFAELIRRGWTDRELKLLAGENVLRVLEQAEKVAREMSGGG